MKHLSYSAIRTYFSSPAKFKARYIDYCGFTSTVTMAAGSGWHRGVEEFLKGNEDYVTAGMDEFHFKLKEVPDKDKDAKKILKEMQDLERNLVAYRHLAVRENHEGNPQPGVRYWNPSEYIEAGGKVRPLWLEDWPEEEDEFTVFPLPMMKARLDLIDETYSKVVDHKYVHRFTTGPVTNFYPQAFFNYYVATSLTGICPDEFIIAEWKKTPNRDGSPQYQEIVIKYEDEWIEKMQYWYEQVAKQIEAQLNYPPNPFQMYDAEDWEEFINN